VLTRKKNEYEVICTMGRASDFEDYFKEKDFRNNVVAKTGNMQYEVYFFLASTLEYEMTKDGYCTFPVLIILDDITTINIEVAIERLFKEGCFNYFNRQMRMVKATGIRYLSLRNL